MSSLLVFNIVYSLEIKSAMLVFSTSFVNSCSSHLLSSSPPCPLHPSQSESTVFTVSVWLCEGGGMLSCVGDLISDQIPNLQNFFTTPNKNLGGEGALDR